MEERELRVELHEDATLTDLFDAIDAIEEEEGLGEVHFEEEVWDNFDPELAEKVLSLRGKSEAATTKLTDIFKGPLEDISTYLPIDFI